MSDLLASVLELNLITKVDKTDTVEMLKNLLEDMRTTREEMEFQSYEEIHMRVFVGAFKQMIENKTYTLENVRHLSNRFLDFLSENFNDNSDGTVSGDDSVYSDSDDSQNSEQAIKAQTLINDTPAKKRK